MTDLEQFQNGQLINNRYLIKRMLKGGMGHVLICHDKLNRIDVALKSYNNTNQDDTAMKERFIKEATSWLKIGYATGTFCVGLTEIISINKKPYIVMEYCPGGSLREKILKGLSFDKAVLYATQIIMGLYLIDDCYDLIHRDVKPENILFDKDGSIKIADLGLVNTYYERASSDDAHFKNINLTQVGSFLGTLSYAAPEQILDSASISKRIDIWAFGIVFFEMITGYVPFQGNTPEQLAKSIITSQPIKADIFEKKCNNTAINIVYKCLQKDPTKRFADFKELNVAWSKLIRFEDDKKRFLYFENRVLIQDKDIENIFRDVAELPFPKEQSAQARIKFSDQVRYKNAKGLLALDKYEECITICDEILGVEEDQNSYIHRLIYGELSESAGIKEVGNKSGITIWNIPLTRQGVVDVVVFKMEAIIRLTEEDGAVPDKYAGLMLRNIEFIERSKISDYPLPLYLAKLYLRCHNADKAKEILQILFHRNPSEPDIGLFLLIALNKCGEQKEKIEYATQLMKAYRNSESKEGMRCFLTAAILVNDHVSTVMMGERYLKLYGDDLNTLYYLCVAQWNIGNRESARNYYSRMKMLAPDWVAVKSVERLFVDRGQ